MADPKIISAHRHRVGETPMWDDRKKVFWWSDMMAGELYRYTPDTGRNRVGGDRPACLGNGDERKRRPRLRQSRGHLSLRRAERLHPALPKRSRARRCTATTRPADAAGRFIFGTTFYAPGTYPLGRLYSMESDRSIRILDEGYHLSNGIGFTPDDTVMYVTDSPRARDLCVRL